MDRTQAGKPERRKPGREGIQAGRQDRRQSGTKGKRQPAPDGRRRTERPVQRQTGRPGKKETGLTGKREPGMPGNRQPAPEGRRQPAPDGRRQPGRPGRKQTGTQGKRIVKPQPGKAATENVRLNRYIANSGLCARREADELIRMGYITVNGVKVTDMGVKVKLSDNIEYKGRKLKPEKKIYILMNKPKGYVTTVRDPHAEATVIDLVKDASGERIYPVGRLDKSTTGVLLLTNDGDLAGKLTHPRYGARKVYLVFTDRDVTKHDMETIINGVDLEDGTVSADAISYVDSEDRTQVGIEIHSGQNRVVRRIFEKLGYQVKKLDRVSFAGLTKKNLPRGTWRYLTSKELSMLKRGIFR